MDIKKCIYCDIEYLSKCKICKSPHCTQCFLTKGTFMDDKGWVCFPCQKRCSLCYLSSTHLHKCRKCNINICGRSLCGSHMGRKYECIKCMDNTLYPKKI